MGKTPMATVKSVRRWKAGSRPVKLQKLALNCMVLRNVMASLSLFVIERHSRVWLWRLLIHQSHQSKLPILSEIPWRKSLWPQFKVLTAGRLGTRRKVAESSSRL